MKLRLAALLWLGGLVSASAQSTINTALPANGLPYSATPIRNNFQAAANDINALYAGGFIATKTLTTGTTGSVAKGQILYITSATNAPKTITAQACNGAADGYLMGVADEARTAGTYNDTITPSAGTIDGSASAVFSGDGATSLWRCHGSTTDWITVNNTISAAGSPGAIQYNSGGSLAGAVISGLVKGTGAGAPTAAVSSVDYAPATSGSAILSGNGTGGFSPVTIGANLTFSGGTLSGGASGTSSVPTLAALVATAIITYPNGVWRNDYAVGNGATPLFYFPETGTCAANSRVNDGGSCANTTSGGNSWFAYFPSKVDVREFGAVGNCSTDDSAAFQAALNTGRPVWGSSGHYKINTAIALTTPAFFEGSGFTTGGLNTGVCGTDDGTYLVITNTGINPFTLSGSGPDGSQFKNFAVVQTQPIPTGGWSPTVYPPVFTLDGSSSAMTDVWFDNIGAGPVYDLVYAKGNAARIRMDNIWGQVFNHAFDVQQAMDTSSAHDWHLWPFWSTDANVLNWQYANTVPFLFQRQDGYQADNIFMFAAKACMQFTANGIDNFPSIGVQFGNLWCDAGKYAVWIDSTAVGGAIGGVGLSISHLRGGGETAASDVIAGSNTIQIDGQAATVEIGDILDNVRDQSVLNITNTTAGSIVNIGSINITGGYNYAAGTACSGTFPTLNVAAISGNVNASQIHIDHFVQPQGCGYNSNAPNDIQTSGLINLTATADLRVGAGQNWLWKQLATGNTYAIPMWSSDLYLYASGTLATLTLDLPTGVLDGDQIDVWCATGITALTVTPPAGQVILGGGPPSCIAGQRLSFKFNATQLNWEWGGAVGGGGGGSVTWPTSGDVIISNSTDSPAGIAPSGTNCLVSSGGAWTTGACSTAVAGGSSGNLQYNNSGAFGGIPTLNYSASAPQLTQSATSGTNELLISNAGTVGSSISEIVISTGTANAFALLTQIDGSTPNAQLQSGSGDTGGLTISSSAGPITLSPATNVVFSTITGATQCLHVNSGGVLSGTGSDCGSGSGGSGTVASSSVGQIPVYTGSTTVTGSAAITYTSGSFGITSTNSGSAAALTMLNNETASGSSADVTAQTGTAGAYIQMINTDGAALTGTLATGGGDTGGLIISSGAGPIILSPATVINVPSLTASKAVCTDSSKNLTTAGCGAGTGTVTTVSVVSANGFAGSVSNPTTTPAITISSSISGLLKGNGTSISAATAGADYVAPGGALGTPSSGVATNLTGTASGLTAGAVPASGITGSTLAAGVTASSLTSLGTITSLNFGTAVQGVSGSLCYVSGCRNIIQDTSTSTLIGNSSIGIVSANTINPVSSNTYNLGSIATEWNNVYANLFVVGGTSGVNCSGAPTAGFVSTNGIVTHC